MYICQQGSLKVDLDKTKKSKQKSEVVGTKPVLPPGNLQMNRQRKMDFRKVKKQRRRAGKPTVAVVHHVSQCVITLASNTHGSVCSCRNIYRLHYLTVIHRLAYY